MKKLLATLLLAACGGDDGTTNATPDAPIQPPLPDAAQPPPDVTALLAAKIETIVVIYAENRGFDNIYGNFPGANGIPGINPTAQGTLYPQVDRNGAALTELPQTWGGVTSAGYTPAILQADSAGIDNKPFGVDEEYGIGFEAITRDLYHRFYENQMQIDGGKNDKFAAWADSGGLVMGHYDGSGMAMWQIAKDNVLADNFFMGAFGGSFLNHQYLICACAPEFPNADTDAAKPTIAVLASAHSLMPGATNPASAMDGAPTYALSGNLTPKNYFGDNTWRAVNTMQPAYQPSGNKPATTDATKLFADRAVATTLPPQTQLTIGDALTAKSVAWRWYAGAWKASLSVGMGDHAFPSYAPGTGPNFQFHHQPFNYYAGFDPMTHAADRSEHLKDYSDLTADIAAGTLPAVTFYKPEGNLNQHAGYASVAAGDAHLAALIVKLQASPQYAHMVIVVTYDENGGWWDHVAPPEGDLLGPGTRIPAIIISPYAKAGTVDHTPYDTGSIQRLINRRFGLTALPGITQRDQATQLGDLTNALDLTK